MLDFCYVDPSLKMALNVGLGFQHRTDKHNGKMNNSSFYATKHYMIYATTCYTNDHCNTGRSIIKYVVFMWVGNQK